MQAIDELSDKELLGHYARVLRALRDRGVTRSTNNPVADYAEKLVADGLGLDLVSRSTTGHDAIRPQSGERYEIKARRLTAENRSRQLSAL